MRTIGCNCRKNTSATPTLLSSAVATSAQPYTVTYPDGSTETFATEAQADAARARYGGDKQPATTA